MFGDKRERHGLLVDVDDAQPAPQQQGAYIVWGPGIDHSWQAEEGSVVITVRWPSTAG